MTRRDLLPDRRSRLIFVLRVAALVVMTGSVGLYGLAQAGRIRAIPTPAPRIKSGPATLALSPTPGAEANPGEPADPGPLDENGARRQEIVLASEDGMADLTLARGTRLLNRQGAPLDSLTVTARDASVPALIAIVGAAYEFGPAGATLDPPGLLTIRFDPSAYYPFSLQDTDCTNMHMAYYLAEKPQAPWEVPWLTGSIDHDRRTAMAKIDHLGTIILFCDVKQMPLSERGAGRGPLALLVDRRG